jgi:hypothetical protein
MANEFIIKNGFRSKGDSQITGSLGVSGSLQIQGIPDVSASIAAAGSTTGNTFPYTGSAIISGSLDVTGSIKATEGISGSFSGSFQGDGSGLTGITSDTSTTSSYALTASYVETAQTASFVTTAQTASYVNASNIDGTVANATSASYAQTASFVTTAQTASYVETAQTASFVTTAQTASYVETSEYTSIWSLGAVSFDHYTFTGPGLIGAENDPDIYLTRGEVYKFNNNNSSGAHPFRIQSTPGTSGTPYNDGVTNNNGAGGTAIEIDVQFDAPTKLYYQCSSHSDMVGNIYIADAINHSGSFSGSFQGDGSGLTGLVSSSYAQTASYVETAQTASFVTTAQTASYVTTAQTASFVTTAQTASYVGAANIDGTVANATSASHAQTSSYVETAQTASFVTTAQTASYVDAANIDGTVANATSASHALTASYVEIAQTSSYVNATNIDGTVANATSASHAQTSSYVDLVAGTNVTINQVGTSFEISGSAGGGTSYWEETTNAIKLSNPAETTRDVVEINTGTATTYGGSYSQGILVVGDGNTVGASGNTVRRAFVGGGGNTVGSTAAYQYSFTWGLGNNVHGTYSSVFGQSNTVDGDTNFTAGYLNKVYGDKNVALGQSIDIGEASANVNNSICIGNNVDAKADDQIVIGKTVSTNASYAAAAGIYIGIGATGRATAGFFQDPGGATSSPANFVIGGNNAMRTDTIGVIQSGAGSGLFYLNNYNNGQISEPSSNMPHSVAMWAKDGPTGVTGLTIKDEAGGKSWIGGRIGVNNVTPTATIHATGEGNTSATTNLLLENSGSTELFKITDDGTATFAGTVSGSTFSGSFVGNGSGLTGLGNVSKVGTPVNNQIGVWTGDGTIEGDSNFTWSTTTLTVGNSSNANTSNISSTYLQSKVETNDANCLLYGYGTGNSGELVLSSARGTIASSSAVQSGDTLGEIQGMGHSGTGFRLGGRILFLAGENYVESSNYGTKFALQTATNGSTSLATRYIIDEDGNHTFTGEVTGSIFSGSFVGNGSGLTGLPAGDTYDLNATTDGSNVDINLTSTSGTDNSVVQLTAGSNITLTRNSANEVTIASSGGGSGDDPTVSTKIFVWFSTM